jgi:hypothetical protein
MNIHAEKLDIIQWLAGIDDSKVIKQFMLLKESAREMLILNLAGRKSML